MGDLLKFAIGNNGRRGINAIAAALTLLTIGTAQAADAPVQARNVVLVHGAWADGSSWSEVIQRLQDAGMKVTAVQNPLTSLANSVAETRRVLAQQDGPTVLVGHSWGGTVVSETGTDAKVTALVYVAARAPDAGEDFVALSGEFPTMPARAGVKEFNGFTTLSEDAFLMYFANGVEPRKARALFAEQEPTALSLFGGQDNPGGLAYQTELVCRLEARPDDLAGSGAVSREAHEGDDGRARRRPSLARLSLAGHRRHDPGGGWPARIAKHDQMRKQRHDNPCRPNRHRTIRSGGPPASS